MVCEIKRHWRRETGRGTYSDGESLRVLLSHEPDETIEQTRFIHLDEEHVHRMLNAVHDSAHESDMDVVSVNGLEYGCANDVDIRVFVAAVVTDRHDLHKHLSGMRKVQVHWQGSVVWKRLGPRISRGVLKEELVLLYRNASYSKRTASFEEAVIADTLDDEVCRVEVLAEHDNVLMKSRPDSEGVLIKDSESGDDGLDERCSDQRGATS